MKYQKTTYNKLFQFFIDNFSLTLLGPWRIRSLGLLSLLIGIYFSSTLTSYFLGLSTQRIFVVFLLFIFVELGIRIRDVLYSMNKKIVLMILDNFRIGICFSIILEAFKLGS